VKAGNGWKQNGQKVKDINSLSIPKYTLKINESQGIDEFLPAFIA
jgi:hypothetical protein